MKKMNSFFENKCEVRMREFDLEQYLSDGIADLVKDILRATRQDPRESIFFTRFALASKRAGKRRRESGKKGEPVPSFLIASITETCNLNCAGCYDRAHHASQNRAELSRRDWSGIFAQAEEIGISAILLAGGEPLMRPDVIEEAAQFSSILFPVFTNGTVMSRENLQMFEEYRNLIPIISVEGDGILTDKRRGSGVFEKTVRTMAALDDSGLLFGASVTVTSENLYTVTNRDYIDSLRDKGCKAIVFVEYVPIENPELALNTEERGNLDKRVSSLRERKDMIIISFPGDERMSGGCLAAGRGFFHINASGGAEPCPFSPHSDTNLRTTSLREALRSPLFLRLREEGLLLKEHTGGCTLFDQQEDVRSLLTAETPQV